MKVGVLTFQNTLNYGAKYQEYALQKYINDLGINAEVIDYINENIEEKEKPLILKEQRNIKGVIKYFMLHKHQMSKLKKFNSFTEKYINKTDKKYNRTNIKEINDIYDKIVVGSDQVWNTNLTKDDYTYYLDFINDDNKKLSYAASFAFPEVPERNLEEVKKLLEKFRAINVREKEGKDIVTNITTKDSNVVVDPTFLVEKGKWEKMASDVKEKEPYLIAYMVNNKKETYEFIDEIAKKENLKIIYVSNLIKKRNKQKVKVISDASPEEFLGLIKNAKYVVTGSFHAICMSIILERNFYYMLNDNNVNSRLINLTRIAGLENRKINSSKYEPTADIDYVKVREKMNPIINESKEILKEMIGKK